MSSANSSPFSRKSTEQSDEERGGYSDDERPGAVPGDGICPSASQFDAVYSATYDAWACPLSPFLQSSDSCDIFQIDAFLDLVGQIPPFSTSRLGGFQLRTGDRLLLESVLELQTTQHAECDRQTKLLKSFQCLGYEQPITCNSLDAKSPRETYPGLMDSSAKYLSSLVLAWSYILSCRWVEALQKSGLDASFQRLKSDDWGGWSWDFAVRGRWRAIVVYNSKIYHAPWILRFTDGQRPSECEYYNEVPNISAAFDSLADFCSSHDLLTACTVALAIVMMLTSPQPEETPLWLRPPETPVAPYPTAQARDTRYNRLLDSIDRCMSLSCCLQGIDSLLGSAFFDPSVPCTLLGAHCVAIDKALRVVEDEFATFALSVARRSPQVAILWLATVWGGRGKGMLEKVGDTAPVDWLVASWVGSIQTFAQVKYRPLIDRPGNITRAFEFSTSFFVRPEANTPLAFTSPPFGSSMISNTSLEVRQHLAHDHRPLRARLRLVSDSGNLLPVSEPWISLSCPEITLQQPSDNEDVESGEIADWRPPDFGKIHEYSADDRSNADHISCWATQYLFGWHAQWDEGLWLAENPDDPVESIRTLQSHQWLRSWWMDDGDEDENDRDEDEDDREDDYSAAKAASNNAGTWKWLQNVSLNERGRKRTQAQEYHSPHQIRHRLRSMTHIEP